MLIDQLPTLASPTNTDEIPVERGTTTYKTTFTNMLSGLANKLVSNLTITNTSPGITSKNSERTDGTAPESTTNSYGFRIRDKNDANIAIFTDRWQSDGKQGLWIAGIRNSVNNNLFLLVDSSGERKVQVSESAPWRTALELCYVANDTMSITASMDISGHINANSTVVYLTVITSKSMENISTITVTTLNGWIAGTNGALNNSASNVNYANTSGYSVATSKLDDYHVRIAITKTSAFTNSVNNGVVNYFGTIALKFT